MSHNRTPSGEVPLPLLSAIEADSD